MSWFTRPRFVLEWAAVILVAAFFGLVVAACAATAVWDILAAMR